MYGLLSLLLININSMVAMEKETTDLQDTAFLSLSNLQHSPHTSQPNSPRNNILQSSLSKPIDIPTTPKIIKDFFEKSYLQYVHISPHGNLNPNNALSKQQRMELGNCYQGYLTNNNNKCFINITHEVSNYNPEKLKKRERCCIKANITAEQYAHILNNFRSNDRPTMTVGRDDCDNYYCITDIQDPILEELPSENNSFLENEPSETQPIITNSETTTNSEISKKSKSESEEKKEKKIEQFFAKPQSKEEYYLVTTDGSLDESLSMNNYIKNLRYNAEIIIKNDQYFVKATHLTDNEGWARSLDEKDQFLIKTNLTMEQIQSLLYNHLATQYDNTEIFAYDNNDNSYCIAYKDFPAQDLDMAQSEIEKIKLRAYNPIALIADKKGVQYLCRIVSRYNGQIVEIHKQKHPFSSTIGDLAIKIEIIPTTDNQYAKLLQIADNQWVVIDKNHQLYISDSNEGAYTLQSSTDTDRASFIRLQSNFQNKPIIIVPLPEKSQLTKPVEQPKTADTTISLSTTNNNPDKQERKTLTPDTNKPNANKTTSRTTYIIGGGLTFAALLAILYHYDKLPIQLTDGIANVFNSLVSNRFYSFAK